MSAPVRKPATPFRNSLGALRARRHWRRNARSVTGSVAAPLRALESKRSNRISPAAEVDRLGTSIRSKLGSRPMNAVRCLAWCSASPISSRLAPSRFCKRSRAVLGRRSAWAMPAAP